MSHERIKEALVNEIGSLRQRAGISHTLGSLGVTKDMISQLAKFAYDDPCMVTNPREASVNDIEGIYAKAL